MSAITFENQCYGGWDYGNCSIREFKNRGKKLVVIAVRQPFNLPNEYRIEVSYYSNGDQVCQSYDTRNYAKEVLPNRFKSKALVDRALKFIDELPDPWIQWTDGSDEDAYWWVRLDQERL